MRRFKASRCSLVMALTSRGSEGASSAGCCSWRSVDELHVRDRRSRGNCATLVLESAAQGCYRGFIHRSRFTRARASQPVRGPRPLEPSTSCSSVSPPRVRSSCRGRCRISLSQRSSSAARTRSVRQSRRSRSRRRGSPRRVHSPKATSPQPPRRTRKSARSPTLRTHGCVPRRRSSSRAVPSRPTSPSRGAGFLSVGRRDEIHPRSRGAARREQIGPRATARVGKSRAAERALLRSRSRQQRERDLQRPREGRGRAARRPARARSHLEPWAWDLLLRQASRRSRRPRRR
jgi:hypothetical protein